MSQPQKRVGGDNVVRDPGIKRGRFEVRERTDSAYIVYDPLRPLGQRTVPGTVFPSVKHQVPTAKDLATAAAEALALADPFMPPE